jgi:hypothetical protein
MDEFSVKKLILVSPLVYERDDSLPFPAHGMARRELLFRMALDPSQSRGIEPDRRAFPGRLVAAGSAVRPDDEAPGGTEQDGERVDGSRREASPGMLELPAGTYLFTQVREPPGAETLNTETLIDMIIEVQREGLWEKLSLDERLYIRRLFEDGQTVTQVFRPVV